MKRYFVALLVVVVLLLVSGCRMGAFDAEPAGQLKVVGFDDSGSKSVLHATVLTETSRSVVVTVECDVAAAWYEDQDDENRAAVALVVQSIMDGLTKDK